MSLGFVFSKGRRIVDHCIEYQTLTLEDLDPLEPFLQCEEILLDHDSHQEKLIENEKRKRKSVQEGDNDAMTGSAPAFHLEGTLMSAIYSVIWNPLMLCFFLGIFRIGSLFLQVFALGAILETIDGTAGENSAMQGSDRHLAWDIFFVCCLGFGSLTQSFMQHNIFYLSYQNGARARALCCGLICKKTMTQTPFHQSLSSAGQQLNLMSNDANICVEWLSMFVYLFSVPIEGIIAITWIFLSLKWTAFAVLGATLLLMPLQMWVAGLVGGYRQKSFQVADKRLKALAEFLGGISIVKMCGWEPCVEDTLSKLRENESKILVSGNIVKLLNLTFFFFVPGILAVIMFGVLSTYDTSMTPKKTFVALALLQVIARGFAFIPRSVSSFASAIASVARIEAFLRMDFESGRPKNMAKRQQRKNNDGKEKGEEERGKEKNDQVITSSNAKKDPPSNQKNALQKTQQEEEKGENEEGESTVKIRGDFGWKGFVLRGVDLEAKAGTLTVITGQVGSGKSTLLHAIMRNCGVFRSDQRISENNNNNNNNVHAQMMLSKKGEERKKDSPQDDTTATPQAREPLEEEGEGNAEYILDVRGSIAYVPQEAWIIDGTIRDNILFGRDFDIPWYREVVEACALVTDFLQWGGDLVEVGEKGITLSGGQRQRLSMARACYSKADIYLLDDPISAVDAHVGKHLMEKCIAQLLRPKIVIQVTHHPKPLDDADWIVRLGNGKQLCCLAAKDPKKEELLFETVGNKLTTRTQEGVPSPPSHQSPMSPDNTGCDMAEKFEACIGKGRELIIVEAAVVGSVGADVYGRYIRAGGHCKLSLFILTLFIAQSFRSASEWWFAAWTSRKYPELSAKDHVLIELALVVGCAIFACLRAVIFASFSNAAASNFHNKMFSAVIQSPMHFFETVPLGRIMNRFAKDLDNCDDWVQRTAFDFIQMITLVLGALGLLIFAIPWFAIAVGFFLFVFAYLLKLYLPASRQLKRLEGVSRSPTHQLFQQALDGMCTLRPFHRTAAVLHSFCATVDITSKTILTADMCQRWIGTRMDWITSTWVLIAGALCVGFQNSISRSTAGLALGQCLMLTGMLQFSVRQAALTESLMTSVERIDEYTRLAPEPDRAEELRKQRNLPEEGVPKSWPTSGKIEVKNLTVAHISNPSINVLKDVSFVANHAEKLAVVGRTGAGKSTLLSCFFRLLEKMPEDSIIIDGESISTVGLPVLRRRLGVIPQIPTLFDESIRYNVDPFNVHTDAEVKSALQAVQLLNFIEDRAGGLYSSVGEQGRKLSVGQKQLLCAARALISKPKILFMDEATANVDHATDQLIQDMIRDVCRDVTVVTIAHRLQTVMHYDKVIVLDGGELVEIGNPKELVENGGENSAFRNMVFAAQQASSSASEAAVESSPHGIH